MYIGRSDRPEGPFRNIYEDGRAFIDRFYNGAQPIDAHFYKEQDTVYLFYGGWRHLNICKMNREMNDLVPLTDENAERIREITPEGYCEAPCVIKCAEQYLLMYSDGGWTNGSYCVKIAVASSLTGEYVYQKTVLQASNIADGPGHNGVFCFQDKTYIVYHRRYIGDANPHHRVLCIDEMKIEGCEIQPITMT